LNPTGTALTGRRSGRAYRLGDEIEVRVESITKNEGKVELALGSERRGSARRPAGKQSPTKRSPGSSKKGKGKGARKKR
jgi:ribonuclease R